MFFGTQFTLYLPDDQPTPWMIVGLRDSPADLGDGLDVGESRATRKSTWLHVGPFL